MNQVHRSWSEVDFAAPDDGVWPDKLKDYDQWMTHRIGDKQPYAPWTDPDAPAPCSKHGSTTAECDCSARFKWGWEGNMRPYKDGFMALSDSKTDGLVFIQTEDDPFVFVDGDDVRCPETGEIHPAFKAILTHLGLTYADISVSGTGVHAYYTGTLPEDETVATWNLDDDPWGENDDLPALEIYSGKHVCVTTGRRVRGTPDTVEPWNADALRSILEAVGEYTETHSVTDDGGQNDRCGNVTTSGGKTPDEADSAEECIKAVNRLDPVKVAGATIVAEWTDSGGAGMGFLPTWGDSGDGGTANFVDETCWVDTGKKGGRGGPIEMALIDLGELDCSDSEVGYATGSDFWTGYEHLRDKNFDLPKPPHVGEKDHSGYYDAPLGDYVDADPWSDPDAMLTACLLARAEGAVTRDAEPPTMALIPIVREYLGAEDIGDETKDMAEEVFMNELSAAKQVDGRELDL